MVTMQDLEPFEELERMRTEFLAIVSHELRTPLTSIQGSTGAVLSAEPGFAKAEMMQFFRIIDEQAARMSGLIREPTGCGAHCDRHAVGLARTLGRGRCWWTQRGRVL